MTECFARGEKLEKRSSADEWSLRRFLAIGENFYLFDFEGAQGRKCLGGQYSKLNNGMER